MLKLATRAKGERLQSAPWLLRHSAYRLCSETADIILTLKAVRLTLKAVNRRAGRKAVQKKSKSHSESRQNIFKLRAAI